MGKNNLGKLIKDARIEKNMSQDELAKKLFVTRQAVSGWETNKSLPGISLVPDLCKYLVLDERKVLEYFDNSDKRGKSKNKKVVNILISTIVLLILSFCFILSAIIKNNDFEVYLLSIDSDDVTLENGILIKSKIKNYFQLGNISFSFLEDDDYIYSLKIFKKENDDERLIYTQDGDDSIVIEEDYGYSEYFNDLGEGTENLFLEVVIVKDDNRNTFIYPLHLDLKMKSNKLFFEKKKSIGFDEKVNVSNDSIVNEQCLADNLVKLKYSFDKNDYTYKKNMDKEIFTFVTNDRLYYDSVDRNYDISLDYDFKLNCILGKLYNKKSEQYEIIYNFSIDDDKLLCEIGNCDTLKKYNDIILKEADKIREAISNCV